MRIYIHLLVVFLVLTIDLKAQSQTMMFGDTTRLNRPFAKDPYVIRFKDRYLMYYSVPGYKEPNGNSKGWGIGIAESQNLINWTRIGEVNIDPEAAYESKGFAAPCALVIDGKVNLFYQTYGNGNSDAICHAMSDDGINFTRNPTNPVFSPTGNWNCGRAIDAEVVAFKGKYYLYYATRDKDFKIQMLGVAVTGKKSTFNRNSWKNLSVDSAMLKPVLPWERDCIEAPSVIKKGSRLYVFYAGGYNNAPQQIGLAVSKNGTDWERISDLPILPNGKKGEWNSSESGHPHIFANPHGKDYLFFQGNNDMGKTWFISNMETEWHKRIPVLKSKY